MKRVALITDGIWPYVLGGMQKHSYYLCKYFAANKIHVDLVHFNRSNYNIQSLEFFTEEEKKFIRSILVDFPAEGKLPGHYIRNSYAHSKLITEAIKPYLQEYDFIYTKGFTGWHLIEQKKKGLISCAPIGVKFHGYEMFQKPPSFSIQLQYVFLLRRPVKWISLNADVVFSYGGKITEIIQSIGVERNKIIELPSGVDSDRLASSIVNTGTKRKFLFIGRYERRKGVEELNIAIQQLSAADAEFHFIGPIPDEKQLKLKNVVYHGEIRDRDKMNQIIRSCDVLLCPSWSEGMPNVILEAMASGLAVIATDVGANNVLVRATTGWLIQDAHPDRIVKAITNAIQTKSSDLDVKKQQALDLIKSEFVWDQLIRKLRVAIHL